MCGRTETAVPSSTGSTSARAAGVRPAASSAQARMRSTSPTGTRTFAEPRDDRAGGVLAAEIHGSSVLEDRQRRRLLVAQGHRAQVRSGLTHLLQAQVPLSGVEEGRTVHRLQGVGEPRLERGPAQPEGLARVPARLGGLGPQQGAVGEHPPTGHRPRRPPPPRRRGRPHRSGRGGGHRRVVPRDAFDRTEHREALHLQVAEVALSGERDGLLEPHSGSSGLGVDQQGTAGLVLTMARAAHSGLSSRGSRQVDPSGDRSEVRGRRCGAQLGDGPEDGPTGSGSAGCSRAARATSAAAPAGFPDSIRVSAEHRMSHGSCPMVCSPRWASARPSRECCPVTRTAR